MAPSWIRSRSISTRRPRATRYSADWPPAVGTPPRSPCGCWSRATSHPHEVNGPLFAHGMPCRLMCAVFPPASSPGPTRRSQSARGSHALTFDFLAAETVHSQHFVSAMDTAELPAFPTAGLHGIKQYSRSWDDAWRPRAGQSRLLQRSQRAIARINTYWPGVVEEPPLPAEGRGGCEQKPSLRLEREGIKMSAPKEIGHIVLNVTDVERSTRFYRDVVGFQVSRDRPDGTGAFLTCGVVHHNLALFKAPAGARPTEKGAIGLNHFAFKVESYRALQAAHKRLVEARATIDHIVDHGMTRSVYFLDPDGIEMELFCDTYATEEEGLAYMKSTRGGAVPMDITAAEPPRAEIPKADFTRVG